MRPEAVARAAEAIGCAAHIVRGSEGHYTVTIFNLDSHGIAYEQPLPTFYTLKQAHDFLRER